jgi:asparagine synthase (glutamine-hydrolysing)
VCGILGIVTALGRAPGVTESAAVAMRDRMSRRGPDSAGLWVHQNIILGHRRLVVIDPTPGGAQPMLSASGRGAMVYNGELYNNAELRRELGSLGHRFASQSDAETVLAALERWGPAAVAQFRGMFALGYVDLAAGTLLLARDGLGIKPLYYALLGGEDDRRLVFASEPGAILAHPEMSPAPDPVTVSAYLTTIRSVLGPRTLFRGVSTLTPGQSLLFDLSRPGLPSRDAGVDTSRLAMPILPPDEGARAGLVRSTVIESVAAHLRSDVPLCALLSGGLDSSIVAGIAGERCGRLETYCAGCPDGPEASDDFAFARGMAAALGTAHHEVMVGREVFARRWPEMVRAMGVPLSTPNEVAIFEVASALRDRGNIVALSGEGADELFGGYDMALSQAAAFEAEGDRGVHPGEFQLFSSAWIAPQAKAGVVSEPFLRAAEGDAALIAHYREEFDRLRADAAREPLQAHLRFQRRINLAGLLQRLDSATMLASVEGRTPLADSQVQRVAESLPVGDSSAPARRRRASVPCGGLSRTCCRGRSSSGERRASRCRSRGGWSMGPACCGNRPSPARCSRRARSTPCAATRARTGWRRGPW